MAPAPATSDRFLSIHYLRAVAAAMVVAYHVFSYRLVAIDDPLSVGWLTQGVAIFFVISGFVMVASTAHGTFGLRQFLGRRIRRVVPLYWFATALFALAAGQVDWPHLLRSLMFLPSVDPGSGAVRQPVLSVGWTLNYEMAFYLIFGLAMLLPRRVGIWAACLALAVPASLHANLPSAPLLGFYIRPYWWAFIAGMLIAHLGVRAPIWCLPIGFAALAAGPALIDSYSLFAILPAALIVASARSLDGVLRPWSLPMLLGDASYAIYLMHLFVVLPFSDMRASGANAFVIATAALVASVALGIATHLVVEKPLGRLARIERGKPLIVRRLPGVSR